MRKVKILFFSADPLSIPDQGGNPRLLLDEEVRQVRKRVRSAVFGNLLDFDWRLAARTRDLQQALEETRPEVVHFSGHGGSNGLVLVGADGRTPRPVDAPVLRELFQKDPGNIRLVVLTACHSLPQAEVIKEVVGCAIGTRDRISDDASITFNAKFYSAIASGRSVQDAFERANTALRLEHPEDGEILKLLHRDDIDPAKLILVSRVRRFARVGTAAAAALVVTAAVLVIINPPSGVDPPLTAGLRLGDCTSSVTPGLSGSGLRMQAVASAEPPSPSEAATHLDRAKSFCRAGNYDSAFVFFQRAAGEGEPEAMAFLGIAYVSGEGTARDSTLGMHWIEQAAKVKRDPRGMNALAVMYENDERMAQRYRWARHWYEAAAVAGYVEAMRNLGRFYRMGLGGPRSDSLALVWYQKAVAEGSLDAMLDLGRMHEAGVAGRRDIREALRLYDAAAAAGSPRGKYEMGRAYEQGVLVRQDYTQARYWYLQGACAGSAEAMNNLGLLYETGRGVKADQREAIRWFRRATDAGSSAAVANLERLDVKTDAQKALGWLSRPEPAIPPECESAPLNPSGSTTP